MYYTLKMPYGQLRQYGPPIRSFGGELRGGRGRERDTLEVTVDCWPEVFIVSVKSKLHTNEAQFASSEWERVAQHLNHRYATDLPEHIYPGKNTDVGPSLDELMSSHETIVLAPNGAAPPPVAHSRPPARRRRGGRIIEE